MHQPQPDLSNLPGGYYGPPILPAPTPPPRRRRRLTCFYCLLTAVITVCFAVGVTALVLWLVYRPYRVRVAVDGAALTISDNLTSSYDLAVNFSVRNPNRRVGVRYHRLEARVHYDGDDGYQWAELPRFYQGHKNTTFLGPVVIEGVSAIGDGSNDGWHDVEVWLVGRVRYKFGGLLTTWLYNLRAKCELSLPSPSRNNSDTALQRTDCHVYRN